MSLDTTRQPSPFQARLSRSRSVQSSQNISQACTCVGIRVDGVSMVASPGQGPDKIGNASRNRPVATPGRTPILRRVTTPLIATVTGRMVAPGHAAIEVLKANGVDVVFGLNGDHVLRLYDGLADLGGITHVTVKHENNAALAAEAYGRLTGRPGVALTTAGPGALNSISGVASAMASGAPLVSLTGAVPNGAALEPFHGVDEVQFTEH